MMRVPAVLSITLLGLAGCAASPPVQREAPTPEIACPAGAAAEGPVQVSVQAQAGVRGAVGHRTLLPGEALHPGEELTLTVWLDRPAHVYISRRAASGAWRRLFQEPADRPADPSEPVQVRVALGGPEPKGGLEQFYVAASLRPLWEAAPDACAGLGLRCQPASARSDDEEPPPPPPGREQPERGPRLSAAGQPLKVASDRCGVAVARFPLRLEP